MKNTILATALGFSILLGGAAQGIASNHGGGHEACEHDEGHGMADGSKHHGKHKGHHKDHMKMIDTDGDGMISKAEASAAAAARFGAMDSDGNGAVTSEEMQAHMLKQMQNRMAERIAKRSAKMIKRMDTNGNGVLESTEMDRSAQMFERMDEDGDGMIALDEMGMRNHGKDDKMHGKSCADH